MQLHRLLVASLLASACALPAAAQSRATALPPTATITAQPFTLNAPAAPATNFLTSPQPRSLKLNLSTDAPASASTTADIPKGTTLLAQTNQPCAKLRSYNFTPRDLKAAHPHPSSEMECTPASSGHLKTIPATANTK